MYPSKENVCFLLFLVVVARKVHIFSCFEKFQSTLPREFHAFSLLLTVLLVSVHFFQNGEKVDPSEEHVTCMFFTPFDCFSRKGTFFLLFSNFKIGKREMYPSEENVCFFTPVDCSSRKGTLFLLFFKFQNNKKMYPSEENVCFFAPFECFSRKRTFFWLFFKFKQSKKNVPFRGKFLFFNPFDCFYCKGTLFFFFSRCNCGHYFFTIFF